MESAASGLLAGINAARCARGLAPMMLPRETMMGALAGYISTPNADFQPMGANLGILPMLEESIRDKKERGAAMARRALAALEPFCEK